MRVSILCFVHTFNASLVCDACKKEAPMVGRVVTKLWYCENCRSMSLSDNSDDAMQREAEPLGVPNLGLTCGLSVAIQLLCAAPPLYDALQHMPVKT
jgi:hypothetical protein